MGVIVNKGATGEPDVAVLSLLASARTTWPVDPIGDFQSGRPRAWSNIAEPKLTLGPPGGKGPLKHERVRPSPCAFGGKDRRINKPVF